MNEKDKMEISEGKGRFQKDRPNGLWMNGMADSSVLMLVGLDRKEKSTYRH